MGFLKDGGYKWTATLLAVLLVLLGTTYFATEQTSWAKVLILGFVAAWLGFEVGWKKLIDKKFTILEGVVIIAIVSLALVALSVPLGFAVPAIIASNVNVLVVISGLLVLAETWVK